MPRDDLPYDPTDLPAALALAGSALLRAPIVRDVMQEVLETYGQLPQIREVLGHQHDQIVAIAGLLTLIYTRLIEHDKRAIEMSKHMQIIRERQTLRMEHEDGLPDSIARAAEDAIRQLHAAADAERAAIEVEAIEARALLRQAIRADG